MKLNQIQKTHDIKAHSQQEMIMFLVSILSGEVIRLNQIKEAHNIKAQGLHDTMMFFHCNYCPEKCVRASSNNNNNNQAQSQHERMFFMQLLPEKSHLV